MNEQLPTPKTLITTNTSVQLEPHRSKAVMKIPSPISDK